LSESVTDDDRAGAVRSYLKHLRSRHRAVPARYAGPSRSAGDRPPGPRPHMPDEWVKGLATRTGAEKVRCRNTCRSRQRPCGRRKRPPSLQAVNAWMREVMSTPRLHDWRCPARLWRRVRGSRHGLRCRQSSWRRE
jgi:hypothetical protein